MKTYIAILIGIVALCGIVFGGYKFMKRQPAVIPVTENSSVNMKLLTGEIIREFEGENKLNYSFDIPETATNTVEMDGGLIKITDATSTYATVYISYEGARGLNPVSYIDTMIAPYVSVMDLTSTSTIGSYEWQGAESAGSEWHIASVLNGEWLIIVMNKKTVRDSVNKTLESFKVQ